ncbi:hypothetical protein ACFE04_020779 [Oxalis oulophora]
MHLISSTSCQQRVMMIVLIFSTEINRDNHLNYEDEMHNDCSVDPVDNDELTPRRIKTFDVSGKEEAINFKPEVQGGYNFKKVKNDYYRVTVECAIEGCKWRVHASLLSGDITFMIKTLRGEHSCVRPTHEKNVNLYWIEDKLGKNILADPKLSYHVMNSILLVKYGVTCPEKQLYRARRYVEDVIEANHGTSYARLPKYGHLLLNHNPGSRFKIVKSLVDIVKRKREGHFLEPFRFSIGKLVFEIPRNALSSLQQNLEPKIGPHDVRFNAWKSGDAKWNTWHARLWKAFLSL